jgi:hypothetical protein
VQHKEWFIAGFLPHIRVPLTQQKVMTQAEAVEITMRLEATPGGTETSIRLAQVQSQLANLTIQLQDMAKTKVMHEHIWCTTCHSEGHHRDECPVLPNYVATGASSPFPSGQSEWCEICRQWGHVPPHLSHITKVSNNDSHPIL